MVSFVPVVLRGLSKGVVSRELDHLVDMEMFADEGVIEVVVVEEGEAAELVDLKILQEVRLTWIMIWIHIWRSDRYVCEDFNAIENLLSCNSRYCIPLYSMPSMDFLL
jgi:hypothetical protein